MPRMLGEGLHGDERMTDYSIPSDQIVKVSDAVFTMSKMYIGADVGTVYLQENSEVTIVLGKGSKIHIVNEGEEE